MGETAGHLADFTILTSDNPRWEDPEEILDDIEDGIRGTGGQYVRIADRREAVRYAMAHAMENDMLVLAGKGHEAYQEICGYAIRSVNTSWWRRRDEALAWGRIQIEARWTDGGICEGDCGYFTGKTG